LTNSLNQNYKLTPLSDLCDLIQYGYNGAAIKEERGPKFLRITDIAQENLDWSKVPYSKDKLKDNEKKKYKLETGDIVIARTGATVGFAKRISNQPESMFASYLVRIRLKKNVDDKYVGHIIESNIYKDYIKAHKGGAAQPNANAKILTSFPVPLPGDIEVQKKISSILSNYSNFIENNLRRIEILKKIIERLYREWFINFHFPGHEGIRFNDTKFGMMPEGWNINNLGNFLVALESGKRPKGGIDRSTKEIPSVGAENIDGIANHNFEKEKYVSYDFYNSLKKGIVRDGDVGIYKDGAYIGKSTYFGDGFPYNKLCINEHVFLLRTDNINITQKILYLWLQQQSNINQIISFNSNAAQPGINQQDIKKIEILIADKLTTKKFDNLISPFFYTILNLAKKNLVLKKQRDLLLPYLISGRIDILSLDKKIGYETI